MAIFLRKLILFRDNPVGYVCGMIFLSTVSFGQAQVRKLGIEQGLSSNYVVSIAQDKRGFIWLATESGLNRFNGSTFKVYKKNRSENTISANELNKVYADNDAVWVATQREGLVRFDIRKETFTTFRNDPENPHSLVTNDVTDVVNSLDGNLWLATYHRGVEYFDKKKETFRHFNSSTVKGLPDDKTWTVREDARGLLYIGHASQGLSVVSLKDLRVRNFRHDPGNPSSLPGNEIRAVFIDHFANVWVGTNAGLALFDPDQGTFTVFRNQTGNPSSLSSDYIYSIGQFADGRLYIGTEKGGLNILDLKKSMFLTPTHAVFEKIPAGNSREELSHATVRSIFQDSFQNIWVGTYGGGINFISHGNTYFKAWKYSPVNHGTGGLTNPTAWGMTTDLNDDVWVGTDGGGINLFRNRQRIAILNKSTGRLTDDAILSATRDSFGNLWFGTFRGGVNIIDKEGKMIRRFLVNNEATDIRCFYEDPDKSMWIGSSSGLVRYHLGTGETGRWTTTSSGLPSNHVRTVVKDGHGNLWVGFFGEGLAILDKNLQRINVHNTFSGFPSNTINHLFKDNRGIIWAATGEGLVRFSSLTDYRVYNEDSGIHNSHIRAITQDETGHLWFSSIAGISRLDTRSDKIYNYWGHEGMPAGDFMSGSVTRDSKGWLFFGSQEGVCFFKPGQVPVRMQLPPTVITGFTVYDSRSLQNIPLSPAISLKHNQNTFTISFNTLDHSLEGITEYTYLLKGLDNNWYNTRGENAVTFRNIPPGHYELQVKAGIKNQGWSDHITSLAIGIDPPFWLSWWAKILYLAVAALAVAYGLRFYKRKVELEHSLRHEKRNHQKDQEIHHERVRFFTNITHELRTPLTLILSPLEDLLKERDLQEKHKARVSVIHKSSSRLLSLINQLLDFQKTQSQLRELAVSRGNLPYLVQETGRKYLELNTNKNIRFETRVQSWDKEIYFDPEVVTTILENLLSNAFKYTESGHISLILKEIREGQQAYAEIEVSDTGKGIPRSSLPKIFDRYYQVEEDSKVSGNGIGLALVKSLVKLHEGEIFVKSNPGTGTSFRFRIEMDNRYPEARHTEASPAPVMPNPGKTEKPLVLVVEDNNDLREYICTSLAQNYQVLSAENGKKGLEVARNQVPDLIISDIMMPEMDGMRLTRMLREDVSTSHIPIILLTAKDSTEDRIEGYGLGIESYLNKPFTTSLVISRIENLLEARNRIAESVRKNALDKSAIIKNALNRLDSEFIEKVVSRIEEHLDREELDVEFLASGMNMSHSTLYRKIKALTGSSINEFIRKVRISNAEKLLLTGKYTISEIAFKVGISSTVYFRQCFREEFGKSPSDYLKETKEKPRLKA